MNNEQLMEKLSKARDAEEVVAIAAECGERISPEKAKLIFDKVNISAEISDDELTNTSGGGIFESDEVRPKYSVGDTVSVEEWSSFLNVTRVNGTVLDISKTKVGWLYAEWQYKVCTVNGTIEWHDADEVRDPIN